MKIVLQRVKHAEVRVEAKVVGQINRGILVFLGVGQGDSLKEADYLIRKLLELRIFEDEQGKMNRSIVEAEGQFLVISQFTLYGDCLKGRRPSFDKAASLEVAEELYNYFVGQLRRENIKVETGQFRAMMDVSLVNDGPVTFILDSGHRSLRP